MIQSNTNASATSGKGYREAFWNKMRGMLMPGDRIEDGRAGNGAYRLPDDSLRRYHEIKDKEDIFGGKVTRVCVHSDHNIFARASEHTAEWIPEGEVIPGFDGEEDFTKYQIGLHKLAALVKYANDFVHSPSFDIESNVIRSFAKAMSSGEEMAIISGDGIGMPYGLLHEERGAETGVSASELAYDDVIRLYFSVKRKYRKNGKWLMNDETAQILRTLKDENGNYLWNQANDTILGKEVIISEFMPSEGTPVLFGDLEYYWLVERSDINIRVLVEKFSADDQTGYLGYEFLDGMLTKRDAVKALRLTE